MSVQSSAVAGERNIRCVLGMLGTDVHTKGIRTLAHILRSEGVEVIYLGSHNTCQGMVQALIDEDADIVGLSFSSPNYLAYTQQLIDEMAANGVDDIPVMIGGLIHEEDHPALKEMGVEGIFGPGSETPEIIRFIQTATGA
jgi:methylmalonyl-CoA mutase, C-terminal domain